jgi:hypothetical protein
MSVNVVAYLLGFIHALVSFFFIAITACCKCQPLVYAKQEHMNEAQQGYQVTRKGSQSQNGAHERKGKRYREKVMRGLKRHDTKTLTGYQISHHYLRPHEGLDGKHKQKPVE